MLTLSVLSGEHQTLFLPGRIWFCRIYSGSWLQCPGKLCLWYEQNILITYMIWSATHHMRMPLKPLTITVPTVTCLNLLTGVRASPCNRWHLTSIGIIIMKIRWSHDNRIFIIGMIIVTGITIAGGVAFVLKESPGAQTNNFHSWGTFY